MRARILRRRKLGRTSCRGIAAASETGIRSVRNDTKVNADLVFRWGCTSNVDCDTVVNRARAIHLVNDKLGFRKLMDEEDLCPATWTDVEEIPLEYYEKGIVVRPATHSRGRNFYVSYQPEEVEARLIDWEGYASPLIDKLMEFRVFVVQGRVACVAIKTPANPREVAWNVANGGRFDVVSWDNWPLKAVRYSIEAFNLSGLDFGGVDVMVDAQGQPYVLEINSAPSLTSPYRQACMAKCFDYIVLNGKKHIPLVEERGGYTKFIHPAVCDRAKLNEDMPIAAGG